MRKGTIQIKVTIQCVPNKCRTKNKSAMLLCYQLLNKPMYMLILITIILLTGCASISAQPELPKGYFGKNDPFENVNRKILTFNLKADQHVFKPVAKTYSKVLPQSVRNGVSNFFSNLWEPMTIINDLLQGKFLQAGRDTSRFVINTALGFLGLNDVATDLNLPKNTEDFGQTLAVWGFSSGPYLVLPFLGPSNLRDTAGLFPQMVFFYAGLINHYMNSPESTYVSAVELIDSRSRLLGADKILDIQPDKYLFLREGYRQHRNNLIYNSNSPASENQDSDDELLDQLLR